jgi:chromosome segregation ATPase
MMTADDDDLTVWRGQVDSRLSTLEVTVETEARVRAQMDQDMSDLRLQFDAQRSLLQAVAQTQSEHTAMLRDHTIRLTGLEAGVARLDGRVSNVEAGVARLDGRVSNVEAGVARLEVGVAGLADRVANLETGLATVHAGVHTIIGLLDRDIDAGEAGPR